MIIKRQIRVSEPAATEEELKHLLEHARMDAVKSVTDYARKFVHIEETDEDGPDGPVKLFEASLYVYPQKQLEHIISMLKVLLLTAPNGQYGEAVRMVIDEIKNK